MSPRAILILDLALLTVGWALILGGGWLMWSAFGG